MSLISSLFSLPGDVALHLESKSEPISFSMGEKLPDLDVNPDNLYFLISGSLRHLISSPPDTQKYFTINIHQPPYIFGLCTYYSKKNVEILTAAEDSSLLRISLNNFLELLHQYPSLKQSLLTPVSSSDIWSFFSAHPELIANIDPKVERYVVEINDHEESLLNCVTQI